jgi:uncharacterized membrane protein YagU involved in acid resistance
MIQNLSSENATGKSALRTVITLWLLVGTLDIVSAIIYFSIVSGGKSPDLILKYIASAAFGKETAYAGGLVMSLMGLAFHYIIAFGWTILFFILYPRLPFLQKSKVAAGMLYGIFVWIVMNLIIVPSSKIPLMPFKPVHAAINIGILIVAIGLPLAFMTHQYYFGKSNE